MLSVIWFTAAAVGLLAALPGLLRRDWRQWSFLASAGCFLVCGILGILSIGILFLGLAAVLIVVGVRTGDQQAGAAPPPPPSSP